jgi:hypothetical protein
VSSCSFSTLITNSYLYKCGAFPLTSLSFPLGLSSVTPNATATATSNQPRMLLVSWEEVRLQLRRVKETEMSLTWLSKNYRSLFCYICNQYPSQGNHWSIHVLKQSMEYGNTAGGSVVSQNFTLCLELSMNFLEWEATFND